MISCGYSNNDSTSGNLECDKLSADENELLEYKLVQRGVFVKLVVCATQDQMLAWSNSDREGSTEDIL